ncbi:hypothetical protein LTR86_000006 [Recurvomyces mirabilis]|nr:hypothetical protein LTR86_000006 [Recurvomyces mirabilis]
MYPSLRPSEQASRSPCPGLNALANHGWLRRSGLNISFPEIDYAAKNVYNFAPETYLGAFLAANQTFNLSTSGSSLTINLRDLARHATIEQDGSQSRNDIYFGDDLHYDATVFAGVAASLGLEDSNPPNAYVTVSIAAKARAARQALAKSVNPTYSTGPGPELGSIGTTALYLATLWDFSASGAPKAWVKTFFEEDRIPYLQGYIAPQVKSLTFLANMVSAVNNASSDALPAELLGEVTNMGMM